MDEIVYTPQKAAYLRWMEQEGIPIFDGLAVEDVTELPRKPWARMGGTGSYIQLKGSGGVTDRKSTRLNSSHIQKSRMPSSA